MSEGNWYAIHTYSGYENKVKTNIEKTIENRQLQDQIFEVKIPEQIVKEVKGGVEKTVAKKLFPGYVLVHMLYNSDTWFIVRNTRGVTGFVGQVQGEEPIPLSEAEMRNLGITGDEETKAIIDIDFEIGDTLEIISGALEGHQGVVKDINMNKQTVTISTVVFADSVNDVEIDFLDVKKV